MTEETNETTTPSSRRRSTGSQARTARKKAPSRTRTASKKKVTKKAPAKKAAAKKAPAKRGGAAKSEEDQLKDLESRVFDLMEEELTENGHVIKDMDNDAYDEEIQTIVNDLMGEEVPVAELNAEDFQTIINAYDQ